MNHRKKFLKNLRALCCYTLLLVLFISVSGCSQGTAAPKSSGSGQALNELAKSEVKEYQGKNLSSITDLKPEAINGTQYIDISTYKLKIDGLVGNPVELSYDQVLSNTQYTKLVTLNCVEGWSADILWEGVLLKDLFDQVQVKPNANTVIFYAADGYTTSLPLQTILDNNLILAYKMNNVPLPSELGYPFQLVAEDKLGYKWIKWVTRIELSNNSNYKGYWESRGYSNEANVKN